MGVHMPLVDVDLEMGCTRFCPATSRLPPMAAALPHEWCFDSALMYARSSKAGSVTIYDSNLVHGGSANQVGRPRPVLMLSYALNGDAVDARDYHTGWFPESPQAIARAEEEVTEYRASFLRLTYL